MIKLLFIDTETTGLDPVKNEVIEIAAKYYEDETLIKTFHKKIDVTWKKEVNLGALKVNNYFNRERDKASYNSEYPHFVAHSLAKFLIELPSAKEEPIVIAGHNISFDIQMLKEFFKEYNITGWNELFSHSVQDTSTIGNFLRHLGLINFSRMSLANLAKALNIEVDIDKTHGALYDVELTAQCYFKMLKLTKQLNKV